MKNAAPDPVTNEYRKDDHILHATFVSKRDTLSKIA